MPGNRPSSRPETETDASGPVYWGIGFLHGLARLAAGSPETRRRRALERWSQQWHRWVRRLHREEAAKETQRPEDPPGLARLRENLVGRNRGEIVTALGPPTASSFPDAGASRPFKPEHYWHAEVWYYPYDLEHRCIIALTFRADVVSAVDEVVGPE